MADDEIPVASAAKIDRELREKKWEQVQVKALTSWINSYLKKRDLVLKEFPEDLRDGVLLCHQLEISNEKKLNGWHLKPKMKVQKIENVNVCIDFAVKELGVKLVGIGAEDVVDGKLKLTLGLVWSLFRKLSFSALGQEGAAEHPEDGLLSWIRNMTDGYDGVKITNFKESFNDGLAFCALVNRFNPDAIDFDSLDPKDKEKNLHLAFDLAEKHLGIPKLLDAEDLLAGNVDERAVTLYSSLFFHAFVTSEERAKIESQRSKTSEKVNKLESQLETKVIEKTQKLEQVNVFVMDNEKLRSDLSVIDNRHVELEHEIELLTEEIQFRQTESNKESDLRKMLEEKQAMLEGLLDETSETKRGTAEERARISSELEEMRSRSSKLSADLENLEDERNRLASDTDEKARRLALLEERRQKMNSELDGLRNRVKREVARRQLKTDEALKLQRTIVQMKQKEIVQGKARTGLDGLKKNLEQHLEILYRWRDQNAEADDEVEAAFDLTNIIEEVAKLNFDEQTAFLDRHLQQENKSLCRVITLKDSNHLLIDHVSREGWLSMKERSEWRKRYFRLIGSKLIYYENETVEDELGKIQLSHECEVVRHKAIKDEEGPKKLWPFKITVGDRKLFLRGQTKKERHLWFLSLTSRIAHTTYIKACEDAGSRPDTRIINLLDASKITVLRLDNHPLDKRSIIALAGVLPAHDEMEILSLRNASITDEWLGLLADSIEKLNVQVLDMSHNSITSEGAQTLSRALAANGTLQELHLSHNQIGDVGLMGFSETLESHAQMTILDLTHNKISNAGILAFCKADAEIKVTLQQLQLGHNQLGDESVCAIAKLITENPHITGIQLNHNLITSVGANAIAEALLKNSTVTNVDLSHNYIASDGANALRRVFATNTTLVSLHLNDNLNIRAGEAAAQFASTSGLEFAQLNISRAYGELITPPAPSISDYDANPPAAVDAPESSSSKKDDQDEE